MFGPQKEDQVEKKSSHARGQKPIRTGPGPRQFLNLGPDQGPEKFPSFEPDQDQYNFEYLRSIRRSLDPWLKLFSHQ